KHRARMSTALVVQQSNLGGCRGPCLERAEFLGFRSRLVPEANLVEHELDASCQSHNIMMRETEWFSYGVLRSPKMEHLTLWLRFELLTWAWPAQLDIAII